MLMLTPEVMEEFHKAHHWLDDHPLFSSDSWGDGIKCLDIEVVKVNPETKEVDNDETKNTEVNIWLEGGPYEEVWCNAEDCEGYHDWTHDIDLDCGAETYEEALIEFVRLAREKYGDY